MEERIWKPRKSFRVDITWMVLPLLRSIFGIIFKSQLWKLCVKTTWSQGWAWGDYGLKLRNSKSFTNPYSVSGSVWRRWSTIHTSWQQCTMVNDHLVYHCSMNAGAKGPKFHGWKRDLCLPGWQIADQLVICSRLDHVSPHLLWNKASDQTTHPWENPKDVIPFHSIWIRDCV